MASGHILVVDDEPDIRSLVQEILQDEGYQVSVAENAAAARELRRQIRPDAILLDIWMPDTDGISLLREWSERGGLGCPVIMISGHGTVETAVNARAFDQSSARSRPARRPPSNPQPTGTSQAGASITPATSTPAASAVCLPDRGPKQATPSATARNNAQPAASKVRR